MKNFKRLVSVLLCIITLFMLATPAMAIDENDDKMPVITQQPKDIVIVRPFTAFDPNPSPKTYQPEFEVSLSREYHYLVTLYREDKVVCDAFGVNKAPVIDRDLDESGVYYLVIKNVEYPEYIVKSEPFKVTFVERSFSEKFDIFIKNIGPITTNAFEGFFNGAFIAFLGVLAHILDIFYGMKK